MVSSMSTTNQLYLPKKVTLTMKFNFDSIFYVRYKSEEISPSKGEPRGVCGGIALVFLKKEKPHCSDMEIDTLGK